MWYLFGGYLLIQSYGLIEKLTTVDIAPSALFFSLIVFIIWSFIPVLGYVIARFFQRKVCFAKTQLLLIGIAVGLIEQGLFYFDLLHYKQHLLAAAVTFLLFFITAFMAKLCAFKTS